VRDSRATRITYVGETARYLLVAPPSPLDKDHNVRSMYGNGLRPNVWIKFRDRFGITEVIEFFNSMEGVFDLVNHCRGDHLVAAVGHHGAFLRRRLNNIYVPVRVNPDTGGIARHPKSGFAYREPYSKGGEIIVAVPNEKAFWGYYKNPEATAKKFERNVFKDDDLWYRTGDALRKTHDGEVVFYGSFGRRIPLERREFQHGRSF
jgi:acyl-CoA synthetase (AMP-forming)/AMP-acid ligase II